MFFHTIATAGCPVGASGMSPPGARRSSANRGSAFAPRGSGEAASPQRLELARASRRGRQRRLFERGVGVQHPPTCTASTNNTPGSAATHALVVVAKTGARSAAKGQSTYRAGACPTAPSRIAMRASRSAACRSGSALRARRHGHPDDDDREDGERKRIPPEPLRSVLGPGGAHQRRAEPVQVDGAEEEPDPDTARPRGQCRASGVEQQQPDERIEQQGQLPPDQFVRHELAPRNRSREEERRFCLRERQRRAVAPEQPHRDGAEHEPGEHQQVPPVREQRERLPSRGVPGIAPEDEIEVGDADDHRQRVPRVLRLPDAMDRPVPDAGPGEIDEGARYHRSVVGGRTVGPVAGQHEEHLLERVSGQFRPLGHDPVDACRTPPSAPCAITSNLVHNSSTRCSRCELSTTAAPSRARAAIVFFMRRIPPGSSPVSGSSRMSPDGLCSRPQAMASFCRMPRESSAGSTSVLSDSSNSRSSAGAAPIGVRHAVHTRDEFEVLTHGEVFEQVRLVGNEGERALRLHRVVGHVVAGDRHRALRRSDDADQTAERRRLARAVGAHEPEHLARAPRRTTGSRPPGNHRTIWRAGERRSCASGAEGPATLARANRPRDPASLPAQVRVVPHRGLPREPLQHHMVPDQRIVQRGPENAGVVADDGVPERRTLHAWCRRRRTRWVRSSHCAASPRPRRTRAPRTPRRPPPSGGVPSPASRESSDWSPAACRASRRRTSPPRPPHGSWRRGRSCTGTRPSGSTRPCSWAPRARASMPSYSSFQLRM